MNASAVRLRRLFFGLWPDPATRDALRRATRALVRHCGGKPVPAENFHLTMAFLGDVPDEQVEGIRSAAAGCRLEPLTLCLERIGHFSVPQVLWIGPSETPEPLVRLASDLWRALAPVGLRPQARPFHAHITLARKVVEIPEMTAVRPVQWPVTGFSLLESQTTATGVRYRSVAEFPAR